jgi:hypothetical protein
MQYVCIHDDGMAENLLWLGMHFMKLEDVHTISALTKACAVLRQ